MNVVVTIFYAIAGAYLVGLLGFTIYKKVKAKKQVKKEIQDEENKQVQDSNIKK